MTLILCHLSATEQIIVTDRRLTDGLTGKLITDEAYKLITYMNPKAGYQFALAVTGLATVGKFKTVEWLIHALPKHFTEKADFNDAVTNFLKDSSNTFGSLPARTEDKKTTFVLVGRYNRTGDLYAPFLMLVSNHLGEKGDLTNKVSNTFQRYLLTRKINSDPALFHLTCCYGDLEAAKPHVNWFFRTRRYMRKPISPGAKFELAARFVRRVGRCGSSVGKDVLGVLFSKDKMASAAEWPETKGRRETLPHCLFANGAVFTQFNGPPSKGKQLSE